MKKNILLVVALVVIVASLVACNSTGVAEPAASEKALSEQVSKVASEEMSSEEVSEEASSEEVVEDTADYSADAIMKLVEELTVKYPYNNPEHIKALVIAANLDYITAEDLDTLLTTYGYSMDDLATLYDECILDGKTAFETSSYASQGRVDELPPELTYEDRIQTQDVLINEEESLYASYYDDLLIRRSNDKASRDELIEFKQLTENQTIERSNLENFVLGYSYGVAYTNKSYTDFFENPYADYQNAN